MSDPAFDLEAPDYIEPITAYKAFSLRKDCLVSPVQRSAWHTDTMTSKCDGRNSWYHNSHQKFEDCTCGIYAKSTFWGVSKYETKFNRGKTYGSDRSVTVLAKMEMWGTIAEGTNGVRATHARIVEIYVDWNTRRSKRQALADRYHCPVVRKPLKSEIDLVIFLGILFVLLISMIALSWNTLHSHEWVGFSVATTIATLVSGFLAFAFIGDYREWNRE